MFFPSVFTGAFPTRKANDTKQENAQDKLAGCAEINDMSFAYKFNMVLPDILYKRDMEETQREK